MSSKYLGLALPLAAAIGDAFEPDDRRAVGKTEHVLRRRQVLRRAAQRVARDEDRRSSLDQPAVNQSPPGARFSLRVDDAHIRFSVR